MNLPYSDNLEVQKLAGVFSNTSATYKFYWFISLIEACEEGLTIVGKKEMFSRMLANAWYTVNYFHVSFGSQDLIQQSILAIAETEDIPVQIKKQALLKLLENSQNSTTHRLLMHFDKNVPHWFLTPWIARIKGESDTAYRNNIYNLSQIYANQSLYALFPDRVEINPEWVTYLQKNARMLKDYCYWNLSNFLQVRNPNIPDIPGKLIKPPLRGSLVNQRKNYWDIVFNEVGKLNCIFTNAPLQIGSYALDHFIPHAFVSHDLIWNLIPIEMKYNSSKSDKLPALDVYFDKFILQQQQAYDIVSNHQPKNKFLDEFHIAFPQLGSKGLETQQYHDLIIPLHTIAANNGFTLL